MGKRKHRPHDPAEAARIRAEQEGYANWRSNMQLPANADVMVEEATRKNVERARRYDCFALLLSRGAISEAGEQAVRRLQEDVAVLHKTAGTERLEVVVDNSTAPGDFARARLKAGKRIEAALFLVESQTGGPYLRKLLVALIEPQAINAQPVSWRAIVRHVTGDWRDKWQSEWVRSATEALAEAYREMDNQPRRAA